MSGPRADSLAEVTTTELGPRIDAERGPIFLLPVGSVEPHGPHLPLATDTLISEAAAARAAARLRATGLDVLIAPSIPYGVTEFARGFAGAAGVRPSTLTLFLCDVVGALLSAGASHVCVVNNHLEPEHDAAVRAVLPSFDPGRASVACPLTRRHARTLSDEFKSGACHAGRYETSLVLAAAPHLVRDEARATLPERPISLSDGIRRGEKTFLEMGMTEAYAGSPATASASHGEEQLELLAAMIVAEVQDGLAKL